VHAPELRVPELQVGTDTQDEPFKLVPEGQVGLAEALQVPPDNVPKVHEGVAMQEVPEMEVPDGQVGIVGVEDLMH